MLIALAIFLASIFGGAEALQDLIKDAVDDPGRRDEAVEVVERIAELEVQLEQQIADTARALELVHGQYDVTREDYLEVLAPLGETRRRLSTELPAVRGELREILTRREWRKIFPAEDE